MTGVDILVFLGGCGIAALAGVMSGALVNTLADRVVGPDEPGWSATQCRKCGAALPAAHALFALGELRTPRVCASCGQRASVRRPLTQIALAVLFPLLLAHAVFNPGRPLSPRATVLPLWALIALAGLTCLALTFIFVVDLEHRVIYDLAVFAPLCLILATAAWLNRPALGGLLLAGVISTALFLLLYGLGWAIYRQEALGFGDVKLAALMGVATGWPGIVTALVIAAGGGFIVALFLMASGAMQRRAFIPFGVFMALGTVVAMLTSPFPW